MPDPFEAIVSYLIGDRLDAARVPLEIGDWLDGDRPAALSAAFLICLAGPDHPLVDRARARLASEPADASSGLLELYLDGLGAIHHEVAERAAGDPPFARALVDAASALNEPGTDASAASDLIWSVLYPEAVGLSRRVPEAVGDLRRRRIVQIDQANPQPIVDAAREVLFTSNVLLGLPLASPADEAPVLEPGIAAAVGQARAGRQLYWFDHPIPIGVDPAANELLHGLRGLDAAVRAEPDAAQGGAPAEGRRLTCLLSVSVTHAELRRIAQRAIEEMAGLGELGHLDVLVATEDDVRRLVDEVLLPAMDRFADRHGGDASGRLDILGVDGEYGRHYSFLKAIAAIWQVFVDPAVRATFKIDLDQVFPQPELVAETGRTALEHLETPLWGARGRDSDGRPIELGLLAGALVNAGDIGRGLFTPDVPLPAGPTRPSEQVFFSPLPQAISTRAEMMERYDSPLPDGIGTALERIHVTGGTSGILVDSLRRHRPFTPSFIGRAEDQAYALSVQGRPGPRLASVHAAGLIMRHDKEAYAGAAIEAALVGKLVGDDVRILTFSAYARAIADGSADQGTTVASTKRLMDPFTGGFIARLPVTTVLLRFALRVVEAYALGQPAVGRDYATLGAGRLAEAFAATTDRAAFRTRIEDERRQWNELYDTLDAVEAALARGDRDALELRTQARALIDGWRLTSRTSRNIRTRGRVESPR